MEALDNLLKSAIHEGVFPGAAYVVWREGKSDQGFVGKHTYDLNSSPMGPETVFDLASVSKVIGTTSAVLQLVASGKIDLQWPVTKVIPEFGSHDKGAITFHDLMVHESGLIAFRPYHQTYHQASDVLKAIFDEKLVYETRSKSIYSDLNMILMGETVRRLTGQTLDEYLREHVFALLNMNTTGYFRLANQTFVETVDRKRCAPTEKTESWRKKLRKERYGTVGSAELFGDEPEFIQGEVHDPTATVLDGVAGHAGLFSTIHDLRLYMENFLSENPKVFDRSVVQNFIKKAGSISTRAIGWDTKSPEGSSAGHHFGMRSFGHTGYTGTSIWCDPDAATFVVLLTNRVHPTSENTKIIKFRPVFHDLAYTLLNSKSES